MLFGLFGGFSFHITCFFPVLVSEYCRLLPVGFFDSGFLECFQYFFFPCINVVWERESFLVSSVSKCSADLLRNLMF